MASSDSESSDVCSPTGSILITPAPGYTQSPIRCFTGFDTAPEKPNIDLDERLGMPIIDPCRREVSDDWIHWDTVDPALIRITLDEPDSLDLFTPESPISLDQDESVYEELDEGGSHSPFHKWMRTLRRRAHRRQHTVTTNGPISRSSSMDGLRDKSIRASQHRQSSSGSSFGFVEAVKTASVSLASGSVFARSRRNSLRSTRTKTHTDRSSRASMSSNRCSEDSTSLDKSHLLDKATVERSLQRRRILEELISTEEGYIGDVRFLMNVYVTILVSLPTLPSGLRSSINRNLADIVELHEELLGDLHRAVPDSEYTQLEPPPRSKHHLHNHRRIRSLDVVPEDNDGTSWLDTVPGMVAEPNTAADVAKVFTKKMNRFFVYEEYGAKYEMMMKDIASAHRTMPQWELYQKGLETLASSLGPTSNHGAKSKKSLTIGDLLVKPIQRVCKYPLLFSELLKYTPVADSPYAHMEIENALVRLREATSQINRATDDARMKAVLEKTWLLQDRLVFPDSKLDAASKNRIRSFGHVELCGVLHACWQTREGVHGQYMVTLLYKDWLCLASASRVDQIYTLQACIPISHIKIEATDNGRGLQCHTAPFSWKIVFECNCQLYEMMLTACTPKEEDEWRSRLEIGPVLEQEQPGSNLYSSLFLNVKSLGTVFGKQGTIARRISIHRATTVGPKTPLCHVIVRNTSVEREVLSSSNATISRTQSLLATKGRLPVLAPSRGDRARLEALLSDVWTRESLPFPGMTVRARNEHLIRTSAHSMIRKLSVTSITSTFTKRSASLASITRGDSDDESGGELPVSTSITRDEPPTVNATLSTIRTRFEAHCSEASAENQKSPRRRARITKTPNPRQFGESALFRPPSAPAALRARSINSPHNSPGLKRQASILSRKSVCSTMTVDRNGTSRRKRRAPDDPERQEDPSGFSTPSPQKRLSRVNLLRRGGVAQGIRGFFR
ncbi:Phosphatidylinositol 3,4,5-trisphosphate-dependent Rac exchanger 1 protein [Cytospora mali]|uniref:Phosphatidylinositol 3,4,5-trisphosphate-dependent Rac exchanger 1 protein n=1 Tax=Cytospora mali TaxID=578113 RepID=A0A194VRI8_CYTMA|nr:Phosphatidylinositol 3,4,5-trisphosphate-dependent Rac exchanger 1 protein [Valsa mali]